jgi:lysozyme family protein
MLVYNEQLQDSYASLYQGCQIKSGKEIAAKQAIDKVLANQTRYESVADIIGMPWPILSVIHYMEASLNFKCHLHNGDPLTARTVHVPAGRPLQGKPPFTWEESALDALRLQELDKWTDWSIAGICYKLERFNGIGYRQHKINSPYLWGNSNNYSCGKYVKDGVFSAKAVSDQIGAVVLLKMMVTNGIIEIVDSDSTIA